MTVTFTQQAELWSTDPHGWADRAEGRIRPLYERALERLDPRGRNLLDAGCGAGLFASLAAERGATVTGIDAAAGLIDYARGTRPSARFVVADLEHLPFDDGAFDLATAFNSVFYAGDPRCALGELARVTRERAFITVGAGPEQGACAALIAPLARAEDLPDPSTLELTDPVAAGAALHEAGFAGVTSFDVGFDTVFESMDDAIEAQLPAGPVAAAIRHSGREIVVEALRSFFLPRRQSDGTVRMGVVFRCHLAHR